MTSAWRDVGPDQCGALHIERDEWVIVRVVTEQLPRYMLWRGRELQGIFPSAHEAAMHADMTEAGQI